MLFLDNHSTTAIHPEVAEAMSENLAKVGNPHSTSHLVGRQANLELLNAKEIIGNYFGVDGDHVVLTSGATEANNLALFGAARHKKREMDKGSYGLISALEHKCVANAAKELFKEGIQPEVIPFCEKNGVDLDFIDQKLNDDCSYISIMAANNETSDALNIFDAAQIASKHNVFFHSDFSQSMYADTVDLTSSGISAISLSGHKFRGPPGIGALVCSRPPSKLIDPILHGGLQEEGVRSGTVPVFLAVGLAKAVDLVGQNLEKTRSSLDGLVKIFLQQLKTKCPDIEINSRNLLGRPGGVNLYIPDVDAENLCNSLSPQIAISSSAACTGTGINVSETLLGMGYGVERARQSIRLCFSEENTHDEASYAADTIAKKIGSLEN